MSKIKNEEYHITLKGLLSLYLSKEAMNEVLSAIELYCRRHGRGITINDENRLDFVQMQKAKEAK
jgi:hypothetical protein